MDVEYFRRDTSSAHEKVVQKSCLDIPKDTTMYAVEFVDLPEQHWLIERLWTLKDNPVLVVQVVKGKKINVTVGKACEMTDIVGPYEGVLRFESSSPITVVGVTRSIYKERFLGNVSV